MEGFEGRKAQTSNGCGTDDNFFRTWAYIGYLSSLSHFLLSGSKGGMKGDIHSFSSILRYSSYSGTYTPVGLEELGYTDISLIGPRIHMI